MLNLLRLVFFSISLQASLVFGAAIRISEVGTPDMGVASAGSAAVARDAAIVYFNPAGMTKLCRTEALFGGNVFIADVKFDGSSDSLFQGGSGGQAGIALPMLGAYFVYVPTEKLRFGISVNSPYGGAFNYGRTWKGRYLIQREIIATIACNPNIAYKINHWLSIGGGVTIEYAYLNEALSLNPIVFGGIPIVDPDGRLELNMDHTAYNYNLGVLFELSECTRFGVSYRSELIHKFHGRAEITSSVADFTIGVDTKFNFAQYVVASLYHQLNCSLALLANIGWDDWSALNRTVLTSDNGGSFIIPRNWEDTWHAAIGAEYQYCDPLLLQIGFAYDSSPTKARDRTPDLPMDRQLRFGIGAVYQCNSCERLSIAIEYLNGARAPINLIKEGTDITLLKGHYSHNNLFFINLNYQRKF